MKELSEYTQEGVVCSGTVQVEKTGTDYLYTPYLNCGENYATVELYKKTRILIFSPQTVCLFEIILYICRNIKGRSNNSDFGMFLHIELIISVAFCFLWCPFVIIFSYIARYAPSNANKKPHT
jgi:hypothetical protein